MRVAIIGDAGVTGGPAGRLRAAGHEVLETEALREGLAEAVAGVDVVAGLLATDAVAARVYAELARSAQPGQVFVDASPLRPATREWCRLALPGFVRVADGAVEGEPADSARAQPVTSRL